MRRSSADSGFGLLPDGAWTATRYDCPRRERQEMRKKLILTNLYDIIKVHNLCKDNYGIRMLKCKHRKEMTLWKTKT